jgi:hypothetical protein
MEKIFAINSCLNNYVTAVRMAVLWLGVFYTAPSSECKYTVLLQDTKQNWEHQRWQHLLCETVRMTLSTDFPFTGFQVVASLTNKKHGVSLLSHEFCGRFIPSHVPQDTK